MFLSGRPVFVESVVKEIQDSHGKAEAAEVDALNESVIFLGLMNSYPNRMQHHSDSS